MLLGTGAGIAFFFLRAHRSGDSRIIAAVSGAMISGGMATGLGYEWIGFLYASHQREFAFHERDESIIVASRNAIAVV